MIKTITYQRIYRTKEEAEEMRRTRHSKLIDVLTQNEEVWQKVSTDHKEKEFVIKGKEPHYFEQHCHQFGAQGFDTVLKTLCQTNLFDKLYLSVEKNNRVFQPDKREELHKDLEYECQRFGYDKDYINYTHAYDRLPPFKDTTLTLWLDNPKNKSSESRYDLGSSHPNIRLISARILDEEKYQILPPYKLTLRFEHEIFKNFAGPYDDWTGRTGMDPFDKNNAISKDVYANERTAIYIVKGIKTSEQQNQN